MLRTAAGRINPGPELRLHPRVELQAGGMEACTTGPARPSPAERARTAPELHGLVPTDLSRITERAE